MDFIYHGKVMWSHLDANMHMRHSAYADFAAQARIEVLTKLGLDLKIFQKLQLGPILFREEIIYMREIGINENITVTTELINSLPDGSRWSIRHHIFKEDKVLAAKVNVDGAWIDTFKRKLTTLPQELALKFQSIPKGSESE
jgi:acyl-CoA thioester hydrolase